MKRELLDADDESDAVPMRLSSNDLTPLPAPLPHHLAEPTIPPLSPADLPPSLRAELAFETAEDLLDATVGPRLEGIANAARQISASLLAADTDTFTRPRRTLAPVEIDDLAEVTESDELVTDPDVRASRPSIPAVRPVDDEKTQPREQPNRPPTDAGAGAETDPLASALLAPIAADDRAGVLQRFRRRAAAIGTTVIRRGETGHGLVLVVRGRLDVHSERSDGARVSLEAIEPGGFVGEISLLARAPAPAYVVAARDSELLVLAAVDFYEVASAFPRWWSALRASAERRTRDHAEHLR